MHPEGRLEIPLDRRARRELVGDGARYGEQTQDASQALRVGAGLRGGVPLVETSEVSRRDVHHPELAARGDA